MTQRPDTQPSAKMEGALDDDIETLRGLQPGFSRMEYKSALKYSANVAQASDWLALKRLSII